MLAGAATSAVATWYMKATQHKAAAPYFLLFGGLICFFLGLAFFFFGWPTARRKKAAWGLLAGGVALYLLTFLSASLRLDGTGILFGLSTAYLAFTYLPVLTVSRVEKWKEHTQKAWHAYFLSLADLVSVASLVIGYFFRKMHWPGGYAMLMGGFVLLVLSVAAWNRLFGRQIVLRKQAEEKAREALDELTKQHALVEDKNREILDSIRYARRIQRSLITNEKYIHAHLSALQRQNGPHGH